MMNAATRLLLLAVPCAMLLRGPTSATAQPLERPQVSAEPLFRAGTWMLSVGLAGAAFSDFQRSQARPLEDGNRVGDFQRRVSARTSIGIGGNASWWVGDHWGMRLGAGWVPTRFSVWNEQTAERRLLEDAGTGADAPEEMHASLDVWLGEAALVFRFPHSFGRVLPYGLAGVGLVRYVAGRDGELPPEARRQFESGRQTTAAAFFGLGAAIPLERSNLLLSFELTNHLARTPLAGHGEGEEFAVSGVPVHLTSGRQTASEDGMGLTSNLRLALGLTLPVRRRM